MHQRTNKQSRLRIEKAADLYRPANQTNLITAYKVRQFFLLRQQTNKIF